MIASFFKCRGCENIFELRIFFWLHRLFAEDYECRHAKYERVPQFSDDFEPVAMMPKDVRIPIFKSRQELLKSITLTRWQKFLLPIIGPVKLGDFKLVGFVRAAPFYAFNCHGLQVDYEHGYIGGGIWSGAKYVECHTCFRRQVIG